MNNSRWGDFICGRLGLIAGDIALVIYYPYLPGFAYECPDNACLPDMGRGWHVFPFTKKRSDTSKVWLPGVLSIRKKKILTR